ncbi:hypothetical protein [Teredinibacter purpureus]|uniref:hypothetical protein n=1 Tax=Teredinibacter purpureus TaxID=2731756 RepID=UPI0005F8115B|nr:hypothetical protein [Teredinibacter purpureus]
MFRFFLLVFSLSIAFCAQAEKLKPFSSDGCSAFPDGTLDNKRLWLHCCTAHDKAYWRGGSYAERKTADELLRKCVAAVGEEEIAQLMLAGVRVGGSPFWPTKFRWGYGWRYPRLYGELTSSEQAMIDDFEGVASP